MNDVLIEDRHTVTKRQKVDYGCLPTFCYNIFSDPFASTNASSLSLPAFPDHQLSRKKTKDDLDVLLASEMYNLSVQERDIVYNDLHGVSQPIEETQDFVESKLNEIDIEIDRIPNDSEKAAYNEARKMSPDYVEGRKFRLMFLRGKSFDVKEAAAQLVRHFDVKKRLFGADSLGRPIKLRDLGSEADEAMAAGASQILRKKDTSGRSVLFSFYNEFRGTVMGNVRALYYNLMSNLEDEEMQRKGVILMYWMHHSTTKPQKMDKEMASVGTEVLLVIPYRPVGLHYCDSGNTINPILHIGLKLGSQQMRARFRAHFGSPLECIYALNAYGISRDMVPVDESNKLLPQEYRLWLEERRALEDARDPLGDMEMMFTNEPNPQDVLLGASGKEFVCNPGNITFRRLLDEHAVEYHATQSKNNKRIVCQRIIDEIKATGGRFMLRDDHGRWRESDDKAANLKLSRAFRNRRRYAKEDD